MNRCIDGENKTKKEHEREKTKQLTERERVVTIMCNGKGMHN